MLEKNWYIIHSGKNVSGPFTLEEIRAVQSNLAKGSVLIADGVEPIFAHDETGLQEIAEHGCLLDSIENVASILPSPFSRAHTEVKNEFISVATNDLSPNANSPKKEFGGRKNSSFVNRIKTLLIQPKNKDT